MTKKDALVLGTRPEIIKCAPIIKEYDRRGRKLVLVHTNQHYSFNMDKVFFEDLYLRPPDHNLEVGSGSHAVQTGKIMVGVEKLLVEEKIDRILVQGDTNTVLGAALSAVKLHVQVAHIEAGLRSGDMTMPEEINRILTDHVSDYLFCPTDKSKENAEREGISGDKIFVVGNTIVDATLQNIELGRKRKKQVLARYGLTEGQYNLFTAHRPANVDDPAQLKKLIEIFKVIIDDTGFPILFPAHPRTMNNFKKFDLQDTIPGGVSIVEPVGYLDFITLEDCSYLIFTDSGGVQEEACILHKPCITLRENTERPETVDVGANRIVGYDLARLRKAIQYFHETTLEYEIPFGKGDTSVKILDILEKNSN